MNVATNEGHSGRHDGGGARWARWVVVASMAIAGCGIELGNGRAASETRVVPAFSRVEVHGGIHAEIRPGARSVTVSADENVVPLIETNVEGDVLIVRTRSGFYATSVTGMNVRISSDVLQGIEASGSSSVNAVASAASEWPIAASGGSTVQVTGVQATRVTIRASGGSRVTTEGAAPTVEIQSSGGSTVATDRLNAERVTLDASGGSVLRVRASQSVQGRASGASEITVAGSSPSVEVSSSGGSRVRLEPN